MSLSNRSTLSTKLPIPNIFPKISRIEKSGAQALQGRWHRNSIATIQTLRKHSAALAELERTENPSQSRHVTQITNFHFCPIGNGRKLATMAQIKQQNLAVPCKNYAAHMLVHLIPIADHFPVKTTIECDICGDENEYFPEDILVDPASS